MARAADAQGAAAEHAGQIRSLMAPDAPADEAHLFDSLHSGTASEGHESAHDAPPGYGARPSWWEDVGTSWATFLWGTAWGRESP